MAGALLAFISDPTRSGGGRGGFQPMPPSFGLMPELPERIRDKRARYGAYRDRALADLAGWDAGRRVAPAPPPSRRAAG